MSNWMLDVQKLVQELRRQKQKYHAKVLSDSAIALNWLRFLDIEELLPFWVWLYIPEFNFSAFAFSLLFDIPPIEFEPINLEFDVELPSLEELLQGILVVINKYDLAKDFPWLKSIEDFISTNIDVEYAKDMLEYRPDKCVYGESQWGKCYVDPPVVREFLRATFLKMWLERMTFKQASDDFKYVAETLNVNPDFIRFIFNRISLLVSAQNRAMILGYGVLGYSYLGKKVGELGEIEFIDYDLLPKKVYASTLDQLQYGLILDITPLNFGYLMPNESVYKKPQTEMPSPYFPQRTTTGSPDIRRFVERKGLRILFTNRYSPLAFANYQRPEERLNFLRSERADQWCTLQNLRYIIEHVVDPLIRQYEDNVVKIRMYKSATLQLISAKAKRHRWGYSGFEAMSEEEFFNLWLEHWKQQGLKEEALREIYTRIKPWLQHLRTYKYQIGKKLREKRFSLALTK